MENTSWNKTTEPPNREGRAELEPGTRLGRYEILRLLGRGGMGQVYLARHELQKTLYALKILPSEFSGRAGFVERFRTELQTMARLQHSNIVHVQYSDVENGLYYLVMDFIAAEGTEEPYDLEEALAIEKRLEPEIVRRLMIRLCDGLSFAHGQGVVHRDLKPANVLLTSKDLSTADVKICDFGLARVIGEDQVRTLVAESMQRSMSIGEQDTFTEKKRSERSSTGSVLGTYGYMSPEQEEGKPADERSDLYSLGVMMYRMITGQRLRGRAKAASAVVLGLDKAWDAIIDKCLENDPGARWQSAAELKAALGGKAVAVGCRQRRKAWLWLAGAAVVVAVSILSIQSYNAKRAETARAAATSAALDAAKTEKREQERIEKEKQALGPKEGESWTSPATGMEFVWIPALKIWVGKYEVTNGEYRKKEPSHDRKDYQGNSLNGERQPVVYVNFNDAKAYAAWLTERDKEQLTGFSSMNELQAFIYKKYSMERDKAQLGGMCYRVPTEDEWQAFAQCGDNREFPWGNAMPPKYGNYSKSSDYDDRYVVSCPVDKSGKNEWGLYGVGGNVWECCVSDASGSSFGAWRGASWGYDYPDVLRCAARDGGGGGGSGRSYFYGFRLILSGNQRSDSDEISRCVSLIRNALYKAWVQPQKSEAGSRPSKLLIRLDSAGRFINYRITQSSGSTVFDTSVLKAAANCPPIRGLTADFLKKHDELTIEFKLE